MENIRTILIAGASGFIGQALTHFLVEQGYEVKVLTRNFQSTIATFPEKATILLWPHVSEIKVNSVLYACDAVINLAGENIVALRWNKKNKKKLLESRTRSVEKLQQIISGLEQPPKAWIQASAIGYYGFNTQTPVDETAPKGSGFLAQVVDEWENTLTNCQISSTRKVFLRFGIVISPKGGFLWQMKKMANRGLAICPGNGSQLMSWIHLEDLQWMVELVLNDETLQGPVNVVSPDTISIWGFTQLLKKHSRAWAALKMPSLIFRFIFGREKTDEIFLAHQQVVPGVMENHQFSFQYRSFEQVFKS
ncbi:MAG: TIGR01777 family oxidoreductase [Salinivirgaceae bacterium]|nr:TIGR01777 family oxidoreductase [Salinivirgaceae bacterium]